MKMVIVVLGFVVAAVLADSYDAQQSVPMVDPTVTHIHADDLPVLDEDAL